MPTAFLTTFLLTAALAGQPEPGGEAAAVRSAFDEIQRAVERRDAVRLEQLVHPAFEMQHGLGQSDTRAVWLKLVASGRLARQTAERREYDPAVVVVGDTALIRSLVRLRDGKEGRDMWMRATAAFARVDGRWVQVNQQSSLLREGPATDAPELQEYAGTYAIAGRDGFVLEPRTGYLLLRWANRAILPLVPSGPDSFAAGPGSIVRFARGTSQGVTGATRTGPDGSVWWTATRGEVAMPRGATSGD